MKTLILKMKIDMADLSAIADLVAVGDAAAKAIDWSKLL